MYSLSRQGLNHSENDSKSMWNIDNDQKLIYRSLTTGVYLALSVI